MLIIKVARNEGVKLNNLKYTFLLIIFGNLYKKDILTFLSNQILEKI